MTFGAKTNGSDDLKAIISAISTLVEEATFVATAEGISFRGMDPSHVALIDISWPNSAFEKYECDSDIKFGVRIDEFSKLIKRADKKDSIEISISEENMLLVTVGKNKKYKIRLIESSATDTPLPKIPYDSKIILTSSKFDKILGDVQVVSDYLTINTSDSKGNFSGKGDSGEVIIDLDKDADDIEEISSKSDSVHLSLASHFRSTSASETLSLLQSRNSSGSQSFGTVKHSLTSFFNCASSSYPFIILPLRFLVRFQSMTWRCL